MTRASRLEQRLLEIEKSILKIETAVIVREPATPLAAEAFDGLRRQILANTSAEQVQLGQLVEFDSAIRRGAEPGDLSQMVETWMEHAGVRRLYEPVTPTHFDVVGDGTLVRVVSPAYVVQRDGAPERVLRAGVAERFDVDAEQSAGPSTAPEQNEDDQR